MRQTANDLTGEHSTIMIRPLKNEAVQLAPEKQTSAEGETWISAYSSDFRRRFSNLLGFEFRKLSSQLALSVMQS